MTICLLAGISDNIYSKKSLKATSHGIFFVLHLHSLQLHFRNVLCVLLSFFCAKKKRSSARGFCLFTQTHSFFPFFSFEKKNSPEQTTRSFPSRNIASGSCTCFEEHFLMCDSLRPIRISGKLSFTFWTQPIQHNAGFCFSLFSIV